MHETKCPTKTFTQDIYRYDKSFRMRINSRHRGLSHEVHDNTQTISSAGTITLLSKLYNQTKSHEEFAILFKDSPHLGTILGHPASRRSVDHGMSEQIRPECI